MTSRSITLGGRVLAVSLLLLLVLPSASLRAQRTVNRQMFLTVSASLSPLDKGAWGVSLEAGRYRSRSLFDYGFSFSRRKAELSTGDDMDCLQMLAQGGWHWRMFGTRSRLFSMYLGGGLFAGAELYDPAGKLSEFTSSLSGSAKFLIGATPELSLEVYPFSRVALVVSAQAPLNFTKRITTDNVLRLRFGIRVAL